MRGEVGVGSHKSRFRLLRHIWTLCLGWNYLWIHLGFSGHCIQGHFKDQNTLRFNPEMLRGLSRLPVSQFSEMIGIGSFVQNWTLGDAQLHISEI